MTSMSMDIGVNSVKAKGVLEGMRARYELSRDHFSEQHDKWRRDEERFLAYAPERDVDALRRTKRENSGEPDYTTITLPYSYAMIMTAHTYTTSVFLGRDPVYQFMGRHGESQTSEMAVESLIDYQLQVGEMLPQHYIWLLDTPKYGIGIVTPYWQEEKTTVSSIREEAVLDMYGIPLGEPKKRFITEEIVGYRGNKLNNIRPYDWFPDPRVPLYLFQDGEFCGLYEELSWKQIKAREGAGFFVNIDQLRKVAAAGPDETQKWLGNSETDMPSSDQIYMDPKKDTNSYGLYTFIIELSPSDWGLNKSDEMQKWVFTCDKSFQVLIQASPLGYYHNKFPFAVMEYEPEGYGTVGRSMMDVLDPLQRTMDWLINSHFYNVRKTLNNQFLIDPGAIEVRDLVNPYAGKAIRRTGRGRGKPQQEILQQLPIADVTRNHMNDVQMLHEFAQRVLGINDQIMGMLSGSGRKTATEVRSASTFGVSRQKTSAEFQSVMGVAPLGRMLLQNTQQYYDVEQAHRIVGSAMQITGEKFINVTPDLIQGFYDFITVDGTLPVDRYAQANLWREIMANFRNYPELAQQYDIGKVFAYTAMLAGVKNVNQFKIQVMPDEELARQQQAGNVVPLKEAETDLERVPTPSQVSGQGEV